ncbi:MAG: hypothetical protein M1829_003487 [Trizodia sp. TS-e1964]|nr:MAG: hypothetical protein M1829_003487 [Trizodia sp. TS-e1964]
MGKEEGNRSGRRGGGSRHSSVGSGEKARETAISKSLSWILRHGAKKIGLTIDESGYAEVEDLLKWQELKALGVTFEEIRYVVDTNDKQRYSLLRKPLPSLTLPPTPTIIDESLGAKELPEDEYYSSRPAVINNSQAPAPDSLKPADYLIRANQGHSLTHITSANLLTPLTLATLPPTILHGTFSAFWPAILTSGGLSRLGRNHIHFSTGLPGSSASVISGMRSDADILIYVDGRKALASGTLAFWLSANNVVLTEGDARGVLGTQFFERVEVRPQPGQAPTVLWEGGREVAQLEKEAIERALPWGKERRKLAKGKPNKPALNAGRKEIRGEGDSMVWKDGQLVDEKGSSIVTGEELDDGS